jgi:hypothetical protein
MKSVTYQRLQSPKSIRLVRLITLPQGAYPDLPRFGCFLQHFELGSAPPFHALSYTWGDAVQESIKSVEEEEASENSKRLPIFLGRSEHGSEPAPNAGAEDENSRKKQISVIGTPYLITENLRDALNRLFISGYQDQWMWIDSLCIDQNNTEEKGHQVSLMGDIYSNAEAVVVWLGADETDLEDFIWLHTEFLDALECYITKFGEQDLKGQSPYSSTLLARLDINPPCGDWLKCWAKYHSFCRRRRWFSRMWVVQEVTLARRIIVRCGESSLSWENIELLGNMLTLLGWQNALALQARESFGRTLGDETIRFANIRRKLTTRISDISKEPRTQWSSPIPKWFSWNSQNPSTSKKEEESWYAYFQHLLFETRSYSATDPRDKIFAVLGIAKQALSPKMDMPIQPDYSDMSDTQSIYLSITSMLLQKLPRLSHLSLVEDKATRRLSSLPSWVPDHTVTLTSAPFTLLRHPTYRFDACPADIIAPIQVEISGSALKVRGAMFDHVAEVCLPLWDVIQTSSFESCLQACEGLVDSYPHTNEDPGEVLCRTLIANTFKGEPSPASLLPSFKVWVRNRLATKLTPEIIERDEAGAIINNVKLNERKVRDQLETLKRLHERSEANISLPSVQEVVNTIHQLHRFKLQDFVAQHAILDPNDPFPTLIEKLNRIDGGGLQMQQALGQTIPFRRVYRTSTGLMGLGPASMKVGDGVWLLQGAGVPFVLREVERAQFTLMGETYLHGFMDGKMAEELKDELHSVTIV